MRIDTWHNARMRANAEYAHAAELIDLEQKIADTIVQLRVSLGLSQAELAARAGTTQATISHLENGDANPRLGTVSKVLVAIAALARPSVLSVGVPATCCSRDGSSPRCR